MSLIGNKLTISSENLLGKSDCIIAGIYAITSPSGRIYIGKSCNIYKRLIQYKNLHCDDQPILYNSLKKHSPEKHFFEIIIKIDGLIENEVLNGHEKAFISMLRENKVSLMNLTIGGDGVVGRKASEEERAANSKRQKEYYRTRRAAFFGKKHTEQTKKILSDKRKGRKITEEHLNKLLASRIGAEPWNKGIKYTEEQKRNHPKPWIGRKHLEETILKMRNNKKTKKCIQYSKQGEFIKEWMSASEAFRETGVHRSDIASCCRGELLSAGGYIWKYS